MPTYNFQFSFMKSLNLLKITNQKEINQDIKRNWIRNMQKKICRIGGGGMALDWNPQSRRRRGLKNTWKRESSKRWPKINK